MKRCPKCDTDMESEEDDPEVGIVGGWYCGVCEETYSFEQDDLDFDPRDIGE